MGNGYKGDSLAFSCLQQSERDQALVVLTVCVEIQPLCEPKARGVIQMCTLALQGDFLDFAEVGMCAQPCGTFNWLSLQTDPGLELVGAGRLRFSPL